MRLGNRAAIVTGVGSENGIGRAIAIALAREGAAVTVADLSGRSEDAAQEIQGFGGTALSMKVDVTDSQQVGEMVKDTVKAFGRIDILVNNAGICPFLGFLDISEALWDLTIDVNLKGYFLCGQRVAKEMVKQGNGGKIVNITSGCVEIAWPNQTHYAASKGGAQMLTRGMALELAPHRINVNAIAPGSIRTTNIKEHGRALVEGQGLSYPYPQAPSTPAGATYSLPPLPLQGSLTTEDVGQAAVFLCSEEARNITGATLWVLGFPG